jgi:hypothetical protein
MPPGRYKSGLLRRMWCTKAGLCCWNCDILRISVDLEHSNCNTVHIIAVVSKDKGAASCYQAVIVVIFNGPINVILYLTCPDIEDSEPSQVC